MTPPSLKMGSYKKKLAVQKEFAAELEGMCRSKCDLPPPEEEQRRLHEDELVRLLLSKGVKGDSRSRTLYSRRLPLGCGPCLRGEGARMSVTTICTRDCFFCFNPKPRQDRIYVGDYPVASAREAVQVVRRFGLKVVGITGGDPLTRLARTIRIVRAIREEFSDDVRMQLYTNGDLLTEPVLLNLKKAGLSEIRIDIAANGYDLNPVRLALKHFSDVVVETPVIPTDKEKLKRLILDLDGMKLPYLILHELFFAKKTALPCLNRGCAPKSPCIAAAGKTPSPAAAGRLWSCCCSPWNGQNSSRLIIVPQARRRAFIETALPIAWPGSAPN